MRASACASPGKAEGGTGNPPPKKKAKQQRGEGGGRENNPQPPNRPPKPPEAAEPPPEGTEDRTPEEAQGDHPVKTGNTKPETAAHQEKGNRNKQTRTTKKKEKKKKEPATQPERKGMGGQGQQGPGQGHAARKKKKQKRKKHTPTTQPRRAGHSRDPGPAHTPTPHARTGYGGGASWAPTQPHTSHKQAETEPQPRTPQTADIRGTTRQTVPKHTHPRPQPGLAGLTKPTPNREPDPNANAAQQ